MYDEQVGRWTLIDNLVEKYANVTPYAYASNNPVIYFDFDGNEIGNPNDPFTKKIQEVLNRTDAGKTLWKELVSDKKKFYFGKANSNGTTNEQKLASFLKENGGVGITIDKGGYESIINGEDFDSFRSYRFNPNTGEFDKTEDWNETHIVISEDWLQSAASSQAYIEKGKEPDEQTVKVFYDFALAGQASHEGTHGLQKSSDFEIKKRGKNGKYIRSNQMIKDPEKRNHEKAAMRRERNITNQYINDFLRKIGYRGPNPF
jgi:hypothetical protein